MVVWTDAWPMRDCTVRIYSVFTGFGEVLLKPLFDGFWKCDHAMFSAFAIMNRDGALAEIEILDA